MAKRSRSALVTTTTHVFIISASAGYLFLPLTGVETPALEGITYFGRLLYALITGVVVAILYAGLSPFVRRLGLIKTYAFIARANIITAFVAAVLVILAWQHHATSQSSALVLYVAAIFIVIAITALIKTAIERTKYVTRPDHTVAPIQKMTDAPQQEKKTNGKTKPSV